jgi:hypothetical protein
MDTVTAPFEIVRRGCLEKMSGAFLEGKKKKEEEERGKRRKQILLPSAFFPPL